MGRKAHCQRKAHPANQSRTGLSSLPRMDTIPFDANATGYFGRLLSIKAMQESGSSCLPASVFHGYSWASITD